MDLDEELQAFQQKYTNRAQQSRSGSVEQHVYSQIVGTINSSQNAIPATQRAFEAQMAEQHRWTHEELKGLLEKRSIVDLERLIATPGRKYRPEFARDYAINALRNIAESDVLPDDIRALVQRILALYETASDPFLGMNLSTESEQPQGKPPWSSETKDAEVQARLDWSHDE